eukprot:349875-Chlamydomonas_euryale.AAC.6
MRCGAVRLRQLPPETHLTASCRLSPELGYGKARAGSNHAALTLSLTRGVSGWGSKSSAGLSVRPRAKPAADEGMSDKSGD